jgi:hypothetical protein
MTEHDLSSMLRDHLADEPPLQHTGDEAIRTARRQTVRRRGLAAGAGALAIAAVAALGLAAGSALDDDDPPETEVATDPPVPLSTVMESAASDAFTPYVGILGDPRWTINDVLSAPVESGDPAAQRYLLSYRPGGGTVQVNLSVGGYQPDEFETYSFATTCDFQKAEQVVASCDTTTLDDGSIVITSVAPRAQIGSDSPRMLTLDQAASRPPGSVVWVRVVGLSTRDGMAVDASEYVRADDAESADWQVPVETLQALALDPDLRAADVAHEPVPGMTSE